jgi:hypothetical protein
MADVLFVALILGFFSLSTSLVKACDRIIGPDIAAVPGDPAAPYPTASGPTDPTGLVA